MTTEICSELALDDLGAVSGGMKYQPNTKNDDVVDARGGQIEIFGFKITLDIHGDPSSVSR